MRLDQEWQLEGFVAWEAALLAERLTEQDYH